jgi:hypothetical protein
MADWAGIACGLGQAAGGWVQGKVEKPAYDESLAQIKENQRLRQNAIQDRTEQEENKKAGAIADAGSLLGQFRAVQKNPVLDLAGWEKDFRGQAAGVQAPAPGAAPVNPAAGAPPAQVSPGMARLIDQGKVPAAPAMTAQAPAEAGIGAAAAAAAAAKGAPGAPPPAAGGGAGGAPQPGEWQDTGNQKLDTLHKDYEDLRQDVDSELSKIDAYAGNDEDKKQRMYAAYYQKRKPQFDALEKRAQDYKDGVVKDVQHQRAVSVVQAMRRGDTKAIEGFFGPGARQGKDPVTGLDGVLVPIKDAQGNPMLDAKGKPQTRLVAQNTSAAMVMWENGLIDLTDMTAIEDTDAKDIAANTRERMSADAKIAEAKAKVSAAGIEAKNKDIQKAREIGRLTEAIANATTPGQRANMQAQLDSLQNDEYKAETVRLRNDAQEALKLSDTQEKMAKSELKNFVVESKDRFGELVFTVRNKDPKAALEAFKRLKTKDIGAAMYFFDGLREEQQDAIKNYNVDQGSSDMGGARPKEQRSAPADVPKADISQERQWAQEALKAQPQNAAKIRKAFREKNGVDI